ncbi:MAG: DNA-directed RNA polymerase subunit omega [Armatimonadota bacterium]
MIYPSGDKIEEKVDSKYSLVIAVAQRAKQLKEGARKLIETRTTNPITIALEEIAAGRIRVTTPTVEETAIRLKNETDARRGPAKPVDILRVDGIDDLNLDVALNPEEAEALAEILPVDHDEILEEYPLIPADSDAETDDETDIDGLPIEEESDDEDSDDDEPVDMIESEEESDEA